MPILKENKALYPDNWKEIRERIRERAGDKCEKCKVENHVLVVRGEVDGIPIYQIESGDFFSAESGEKLGATYVGEFSTDERFIQIVCTVAHLDHDPGNNSDENLRFWCQRCHNNYDREHRNATRKKNKALKFINSGQMSLEMSGDQIRIDIPCHNVESKTLSALQKSAEYLVKEYYSSNRKSIL